MLAIKKFTLTLTSALAITFAMHIAILSFLNLPLFENKIIEAYLFNYLLALGIYFLLYKLSKKESDQLGFLFMAGSFLKFLLFFLLFYGAYKADGKITRIEFTSFFVPYVVCLFLETFSLSKLLNK